MSVPDEQPTAGGTVSPWAGTGPEVVIAGLVILVAAAAGYLMAGWAGLSVAVTAGAAAAMVVLRYLLPTLTPDAARRLLCRRPRDADLWPWIEPTPEGAEPETRASKAGTEPGIPRRTLARLIDRLERL